MNRKLIPIAIIFVLVIGALILFSVINSSNDTVNDTTYDVTQTTEESTTADITTTETTTDAYTVPASELGFYYLEEMGNGVVEIEGYNVSGSDDDYVYTYFQDHMYMFENGYMITYTYWTEGYFERNSTALTYSIVNNDMIDIGYSGPSRYFSSIDDRKTSSYRDDFVVFVDESTASWYVPYSLIDFDRSGEGGIEFETDEGKTAYKYYLK